MISLPITDLLYLGFGYGAATTNNGNMMQQTIWAPDNGSGAAWQVTQDYTYDQVNRLATAEEKLGGVPQWSRTYDYDHFGNRWVDGHTGHTLHFATPTSSAAIQATTNRLTGTGITYDNAGNLTAHPHITPGGWMTYDANNKMVAFTATGVSVSTAYDAADRRVRKVHNTETTIWVYDAFGKLAAEYTTEAHTLNATLFRTTDHLGSTRLTTDDVGDVVARRDYFPFGERTDSTLSSRGSVVDGILASFNASPGMRQQFTGQQRDDETDLDYFWERRFHARSGRFLGIDPYNAGALSDRPETWNGYGYVDSNPLRYVDPSGLGLIDVIGSLFGLSQPRACGGEGQPACATGTTFSVTVTAPSGGGGGGSGGGGGGGGGGGSGRPQILQACDPTVEFCVQTEDGAYVRPTLLPRVPGVVEEPEAPPPMEFWCPSGKAFLFAQAAFPVNGNPITLVGVRVMVDLETGQFIPMGVATGNVPGGGGAGVGMNPTDNPVAVLGGLRVYGPLSVLGGYTPVTGDAYGGVGAGGGGVVGGVITQISGAACNEPTEPSGP